MRRLAIIMCGVLGVLTATAETASARWVVGIGIGLPIYAPGPRVYYPYYPYYPYYYPAPVVVQPAYPPPVVVGSAPAPVAPAPTVAAAPPQTPEVVQPPTLRPVVGDDKSADIDRRIEHLANPNEKVRADVAIELGRMKADKAVDALTKTLANDSSAVVREAAARALGLIGSPRALTALQHAAQSDNDRDVRNSARFAADVIQTNR